MTAASVTAGSATRAARRAGLQADVTIAARILTPAWPIDTFIAVNPLGGLENQPFDAAIRRAGEAFGARGVLGEEDFRDAHGAGRITDRDLLTALARSPPGALDAAAAQGGRALSAATILLADLKHGAPSTPPVRRLRTRSELAAPDIAAVVDGQAARWCAAFLDTGQAGWRMPRRERGFYAAWRALGPRDRSLSAAVRARLGELPERPGDALLDAVDALGIPEDLRRSYLEAHLTALPGWASHVRWRAEHAGGIDLVDYLALRIALERLLLEEAGAPRGSDWGPAASAPQPPAAERAARVADALPGSPTGPAELEEIARVLDGLPAEDRPLVWLDAYESHYRDDLLAALAQRPAPVGRGRPAAQLVCCIDARSEGLRRHLEQVGSYETLGFAGFFAVAIRFRDLAGGHADASCPVLLQPRNEISEHPAAGGATLAERHLAGQRALTGADEAFHAAKDELVAPFVLAEAAGWAAGPLAAAKTFSSGRYGALRGRLHRRAAPPAETVLDPRLGFSFEERALLAEVALRMMGLTAGFARLVVLCGHGSATENNPYEAALDCGACGGHRGGPNARVAAAILNGPDVRLHLARQGIEVPPDTWFVAAEHDTAIDVVTVLDEHLVPEDHRADLGELTAHLGDAAARLSAERCADLPGAPRHPGPETAARHVRARSTDWAQVFPEWGLVRNAAFVVGPRTMTAGIDLQRRVFLHSYEAAADPDGSALETILTAPLVVAQWISCQYYFSSVDPEIFGAGTKTIHNVVGNIGVQGGQAGDLKLGLPWQSVAVGDQLVHEPLRLLAIVQAPRARIEPIIARNRVLRDLFGNGWVALAARDAPEAPWMRHTHDGFVPWTDKERLLDAP